MKIKVLHKSYDEVMALSKPKHKKPHKPLFLLSLLIYLLSLIETRRCGFTFEKNGMERLKKGEPFLILMNHSAFLDLQIVSRIFFPRRYTIVTTSDAFVGKRWLMRMIGCIATQKFVTDLTLLRDIRYSLEVLRCPVLMYPEASYSFDGRSTTLPDTLGSFLKMMKVPVVTVMTEGVFSRDPLYNGLQLRKVKPSARVTYLLSPEEIAEKTPEQLNALLRKTFDFDGFAWQRENKVKIAESFRADGLNRILFRCCMCGGEGNMQGKGTQLTCLQCGRKWELTEYGELRAAEGETRFSHVPDWYQWQAQEIQREIAEGSYLLDCEVDIGMMVDYRAIYMVGSGRLRHDAEGFLLFGCDGKCRYRQKPQASYGLYADYFWYEIADVICIGDRNVLYYCFPKGCGDVVARTRIAAEAMFRMFKSRRRPPLTAQQMTEGE